MFCITVAAAALAGLPPLSGFFSKEVILTALAGLNNPLWLMAGLLGAFLTAYYAFRLIFIILFPQKPKTFQASNPSSDHAKSDDRAMGGPLIILALITLLLGFCQGPLENFLSRQTVDQLNTNGRHLFWLPFAASGSALGGIMLAWREFGRRGAEQVGFAERITPLHDLFAERWYIDRFYRRFLDVIIYGGISNLCTRNDNTVIDGSLDGLSRGTVETGRLVSFLHSGMIQYKLLVIFIVLVLLALYYLF